VKCTCIIPNLSAAISYFNPILYNNESETSNIKYGLDGKFSNEKWINIFEGIDVYEHILTLQFDKTYQQQHSLQFLFSALPPNRYMLKPTSIAIANWETIWSETDIRKDGINPDQTFMAQLGIPGGFFSRPWCFLCLYAGWFDDDRR